MPFDLAFRSQALRSKLRGSSNRYKIKLRAAGFRLIDEVRDQQVLVLVLAVGKPHCNATYTHECPAPMFRRRAFVTCLSLALTLAALDLMEDSGRAAGGRFGNQQR
jgi:hypothetical protein